MARDTHQFCALHRIGYDTRLDPTCPQCMLSHVAGQQQLAFDTELGMPVDDKGQVLDRRTLKPPQRFDPATGAPIQA